MKKILAVCSVLIMYVFWYVLFLTVFPGILVSSVLEIVIVLTICGLIVGILSLTPIVIWVILGSKAVTKGLLLFAFVVTLIPAVAQVLGSNIPYLMAEASEQPGGKFNIFVENSLAGPELKIRYISPEGLK